MARHEGNERNENHRMLRSVNELEEMVEHARACSA